MKKTLLYCFILCCPLFLHAQTEGDKATFLSAKWQKNKLAKGLTWYHFHFADKQLFQSNQNIHYLKFDKKHQSKWHFQLASGGDSLVKTSDLAKQSEAFVAVNGSFFDVKNGGAVDFIRINGRVLDTTRLDAKGRLTFHQKAAMVINTQNKVGLAKQNDSTDVKWADKEPFDHVMVTGPLLIWEGEKAPLSKIAFNDNRHPRTCACWNEKDDLILLTVDGRTAESQGLNLHELSFLLKNMGCRYAVNLDGGGSTTMYIAGQPDNGVVNMPCDNKLFDHAGERRVSNIVMAKKKKTSRSSAK